MSQKLIYEVMGRATLPGAFPTSFGFFTDDFLAKQAVDRLYENLRQEVLRSDFVPTSWTDQALRDAIVAQGWDTWMVDDKNGLSPMFFFRPATLYNAVPSHVTNFTFVEDDSGINPF